MQRLTRVVKHTGSYHTSDAIKGRGARSRVESTPHHALIPTLLPVPQVGDRDRKHVLSWQLLDLHSGKDKEIIVRSLSGH